MPDHKAIVPLDNFTQNGDQTLDELIDAVAAVNGNTKPGVANQVRDPATGKLVRVELTFPDTVSDNAINAINADAGVPTTVGAVPQQWQADDLDDTAGLAFSQTLEVESLPDTGHRIDAEAVPELGLGVQLGYLRNTGAGNAYTDQDEALSAMPLRLQLNNYGDTSDFVVASGEVTVKVSAAKSQTLTLQSALTIPKRIHFSTNFVVVYVDESGNVYLQQSRINGIWTGPFTFEEAVANGAL